MDFAYSDEQGAISELARKIFSDRIQPDGLRALERSEAPRFDEGLWRALADAGLVGIAIPEAEGGGGLGFLELSVILDELGRAVAPVPLYESLVLGSLPLVEFGSDAQRERWLPAMACGEAIWTAALQEPEASAAAPETRARAVEGGFRLSGEKIGVPAAELASGIWTPALLEDGSVGIFGLDPTVSGVEIVPVVTTSGQPEAMLRLDGARVEAEARLAPDRDGLEVIDWIRLRATAGLCSMAAGVCQIALDLTAEYVKTRKQFDQPIAMFQAVGHRIADAYIDTESVKLSAQQAAWRIGAGRPAEAQVAIAKFFAAEAGNRVVLAAQHLHGGMGVDRDYPLHRYYLYAKQIELTLGGGSYQLRTLGRMLADEGAST